MKIMRRSLLAFSVAVAALVLATSNADAREPNLTETDRRGNQNGFIEYEEIDPPDRQAITRYATLAGIEISQPMPIRKLIDGRARYFSRLTGESARSVEPAQAGKRGFGVIADNLRIKGFGELSEMAAVANDEDRRVVISHFGELDTNRDERLSRQEIGDSRFGGALVLWFRGDCNRDGHLTFTELSFYFASRRGRGEIKRAQEQSTWNIDGVEVSVERRQHAARMMASFDKNGNGIIDRNEVPEQWNTGNGLAWTDTNGDGQITTREMQLGSVRFQRENDLSQEKRKNVDLKHCGDLSTDMMRRYDLNRDGTLNRSEWLRIEQNVGHADLNRNGLIVHIELAQWLLSQLQSQPGSKLPDGLPVWFVESDVDFDGQVLLSEFLTSRPGARRADFQHYDANDDGVVTPVESASRWSNDKTQYANSTPHVLEAVKEVVSEIVIPDDMVISDIDVRISISKDGDDDLEFRLVGPSGQTAWLYYNGQRKPWGGDRLFEDTLIDDEASLIRQRLPRRPAHGSFRPQSMDDPNRSSLKVFYGTPARGTWRLIIGNRARNSGRRAGLLEGWALLVKAD